jgi:hypothetical protein
MHDRDFSQAVPDQWELMKLYLELALDLKSETAPYYSMTYYLYSP